MKGLGAWVPHPFAPFAKGWETSNSVARKRRLAAPQVLLADYFQHPATLKLDRPSRTVRRSPERSAPPPTSPCGGHLSTCILLVTCTESIV